MHAIYSFNNSTTVLVVVSGREFYIVSEHSGKVLDISRGSMEPGAEVCVWSKHPVPAKNQLWHLDQRGFIRSALNDFILEAEGITIIVTT